MIRVERLKKPQIGGDPVPDGYWETSFPTIEGAEAAIEEQIAGYHHHGFDSKHGYWWARNLGEVDIDIFVVRPNPGHSA